LSETISYPIQFKSPLVQVLYNQLYPQVKEEMSALEGLYSWAWKSIEPQIPDFLRILDENPEAQQRIIAFLKELITVVEEAENKETEEGAKIEE